MLAGSVGACGGAVQEAAPQPVFIDCTYSFVAPASPREPVRYVIRLDPKTNTLKRWIPSTGEIAPVCGEKQQCDIRVTEHTIFIKQVTPLDLGHFGKASMSMELNIGRMDGSLSGASEEDNLDGQGGQTFDVLNGQCEKIDDPTTAKPKF